MLCIASNEKYVVYGGNSAKLSYLTVISVLEKTWLFKIIIPMNNYLALRRTYRGFFKFLLNKKELG